MAGPLEALGSPEHRWNGRDFGRLEGRVEALSATMGSLVSETAATRQEVHELQEKMASTRGALRVLLGVAALGGVLGAGSTHLLQAISSMLGP